MAGCRTMRQAALVAALLAGCSSGAGCYSCSAGCGSCPSARLRKCPPPDLCAYSVPADVPRECEKTRLTEYVIEPPDILLVDALHVTPRPPYIVKTLDALAIRVPKALPTDPIAGIYAVDPEGSIHLGVSYGNVHVAGMTLAQAKAAIEKQLTTLGLQDPRAEVSVAESRGLQQIRGQHLVRPDGTVGLGVYGSVQVSGLTIAAAKAAIEKHLAQYLETPEVSVDVAAFNSKVFYVIYDGGGAGQQVYRLPATGNDTVLDAVSQLNGLSQVSDTNKMWVARPTCTDEEQILPVDWCGITTRGRHETNYQLAPGDRLYVNANKWVTFDTRLGRLLAPVERVFGITLLASSTVHSVGGKQNSNP